MHYQHAYIQVQDNQVARLKYECEHDINLRFQREKRRTYSIRTSVAPPSEMVSSPYTSTILQRKVNGLQNKAITNMQTRDESQDDKGNTVKDKGKEWCRLQYYQAAALTRKKRASQHLKDIIIFDTCSLIPATFNSRDFVTNIQKTNHLLVVITNARKNLRHLRKRNWIQKSMVQQKPTNKYIWFFSNGQQISTYL